MERGFGSGAKVCVVSKQGLRCKTLCDVLYDTLGEFGAIQA